MVPIFVRAVKPEEGKLYLDWSMENPSNEFDPFVALYPSSSTWCAFDKDGPIAFQTIQRPFMMESMAFRPGITDLQKANAMRELTQNAVTQAIGNGAGEIYFLGSSSDTNEFATNNIFEEIPFKVFRVKVSELEVQR